MDKSYTYIGLMTISSIVFMGCSNGTENIAEPEETEEVASIDENDDALAQHPDDLNEGETILQNAIFTNESTESYYIELRITNEFDEELELKDDARDINEYVLYDDDVIYSREEHLDHAAGVLYTSNDAERIYNYLEDHLVYESEELLDEGTTNLSAWVGLMRNAIETIDSSNINYEGLEEVNGDPSYKVSVSDEGAMTTFWLEESTFNVRQTETQLHESDQESDTTTTTEILDFISNRTLDLLKKVFSDLKMSFLMKLRKEIFLKLFQMKLKMRLVKMTNHYCKSKQPSRLKSYLIK